MAAQLVEPSKARVELGTGSPYTCVGGYVGADLAGDKAAMCQLQSLVMRTNSARDETATFTAISFVRAVNI